MGNAKIVNNEARSVLLRIASWGFFGAKSLPFLASTKLRRTLGQTSSPKTKQKRKNTLYLSHKNPFNGLTIIFNTMKVLTLVIFLSTCDYDCSLLSHF